MSKQSMTFSWAAATVLAATAAVAGSMVVDPPVLSEPTRKTTPVLPPKPRRLTERAVPAWSPEPPTLTRTPGDNGFATSPALLPGHVPVPDLGSALTPPVTINYGGSSPAMLITDSGSSRALQAIITSSTNTGSALFGQTAGSGAGLTGYNTGTGGPAGKFGVTNAVSQQPAVYANTLGAGSAIIATVTNRDSFEPAIYAENNASQGYGVGVQGNGINEGVYGYSENGTGSGGSSIGGTGIYGQSQSGIGVQAESTSSVGLSAFSNTGTAISATSNTDDAMEATSKGSGYGVMASSASGFGVYASSGSGTGVRGHSNKNFGVIGDDASTGTGVYGTSDTGIGVWGHSNSGYAGYFSGTVAATTYVTLSDRNAKAHLSPINGKEILDSVSHLSIATWNYKTDPDKRHIGPMAQDFHAAFGLGGDDDTHINLSDSVGVSFAAIQELAAEIRARDSELVALKLQMASQTQALQVMTADITSRLTTVERQACGNAPAASLAAR